MRIHHLIWKEMRKRPTPMITSLLAVTLGVMALVAIQNIAVFSQRKIAGDMESLGANVLVLPPNASLQDYYAADMHGQTMPEEYVTRLALARLPGVENLAPKLCVETTVNGQNATVTGILPRSEYQAKSAWQGLGMLTNAVGSDRGCCSSTSSLAGSDDPNSLATERTIQDLGPREVVLGSHAAERMALKVDDKIRVFDQDFTVLTVLPETGTIDDSRLFAHLHSVQELASTGPVVNVIEIIACCDDAAGGLTSNLSAALPETKIITISQIVQTQLAVNTLMSRLSWLFFSILLLVGASSIASVMFANVTERRQEIGTLMALGASRGFVTRLFLGKAVVLGVVGGIAGYVGGTGLAIVVGPRLLNVTVEPLPGLLATGLAAATLVAVLASYLPARRAASLDPCLVFNDA